MGVRIREVIRDGVSKRRQKKKFFLNERNLF